MDALKETLAMVGAFYGILSAFCVWVMFTGGPKADGQKGKLAQKERYEKAREALAVGTACIWIVVVGATVIWCGCYLVTKVIG